MKKIAVIIGLILLIGGIYFASSVNDSNFATVTAVGISALKNNDISTAREEALNQAFALAIEQSVKVLISHEVEVDNAVTIKDKILKKASGYIKSFSILSEGPLPPQKDPATGKWVKLYQVKIKAVVGKTSLKKDLSDIIFNLGDPRILVISGDINNQTPLQNEIETLFENKLLSKGFRIYDRKQLKEVQNREKLALLKVGSKEDLFDVGLWFGVDMIVKAKFESVDQGKFEGMDSVYSMLNYKVIYTKTAQLVDAQVLSQSALFVNYKSGTYALANYLITHSNIADNIVKWLISERASLSGKKYSLIFSGFENSNEVSNFEAYLSTIHGIKHFNRTQISLNSAKYEFRYFGSTAPLVRTLSEFENGSYTVSFDGNEKILMIKKQQTSSEIEIKFDNISSLDMILSIKKKVSDCLNTNNIQVVSFGNQTLVLKVQTNKKVSLINVAMCFGKKFEIVSMKNTFLELKAKK